MDWLHPFGSHILEQFETLFTIKTFKTLKSFNSTHFTSNISIVYWNYLSYNLKRIMKTYLEFEVECNSNLCPHLFSSLFLVCHGLSSQCHHPFLYNWDFSNNVLKVFHLLAKLIHVSIYQYDHNFRLDISLDDDMLTLWQLGSNWSLSRRAGARGRH